ncbi:MAG: hypothetical protein ACFFDB_20310, partial [Promethearchaeota archaeon]
MPPTLTSEIDTSFSHSYMTILSYSYDGAYIGFISINSFIKNPLMNILPLLFIPSHQPLRTHPKPLRPKPEPLNPLSTATHSCG